MEKLDRKTLCKVCLEDYKSTVIGGFVGATIAILTGFLAAVPISIFGGFLMDSTVCDECGDEGEDLHQIVMADRDEPGWFFRETEAAQVDEGSEGPEFTVEHDLDSSFDFDMDMEGFGDE